MQAFCGRTEVTPIHPFKLELRVSETDAVYEGLYVFDPAALGPGCGRTTLVLRDDIKRRAPAQLFVDLSVACQFSDASSTPSMTRTLETRRTAGGIPVRSLTQVNRALRFNYLIV